MILRTKIYPFIVLITIGLATAQNFWKVTDFNKDEPKDDRVKIVWCTISYYEQEKCYRFGNVTSLRDNISVGYKKFNLSCIQASSKEECMKLLDEGKATLTTLDAGEIFVAGRYHSLVPIAQEVLDGNQTHYYSVAVVRKGTLPDVTSLRDLRNKKACFPGVQTFAGWALPIYTLMKYGGMEIADCNNHVKSAIEYFGPSCAVNSLSDKFNPIGDNSDKLCRICIGKIPGGRCTNSDPYAGYEGAFRCLLEAGEIAFLKHTTALELIRDQSFIGLGGQGFELLCLDGARYPIEQYESCNWGKVPSDAIVASSAATYEDRKLYQKFLKKVSRFYSSTNGTYLNNYNNPNEGNNFDQFGNRLNKRKRRQNFDPYNENNQQNGRYNPYGSDQYDQSRVTDQNGRPVDPLVRDPYLLNKDYYGQNIDPYDQEPRLNQNGYNENKNWRDEFFDDNAVQDSSDPFYIFKSPRDAPNLLFQDSTVNISAVPENLQTYTSFLGPSLDIIMGVRQCPIVSMTLCVTSDAELEKCIRMKTALKAQLLKPEMDCYKGHSHIHCMQAIRAGTADVSVFDASDVYTAGLNYDLIPFIAEVYNLDDAEYYVVAVGKESDPSTELTYLKGKNTCHGGVNTAAGWVYPMAFLLSNGWIRPYGCNSIRAAAEYFSKSCVPGALSTEYNSGLPYDNMCHLCHGSSFRYCRRDASEGYYGHTGAFRCLVEGGGHVAFVKHTTVTENTGGKKREWWARDNLNDDYELLCTDGTRKEINDYKKCNLGKVKANAIVGRGGYGYNNTEINTYINLFLYAQTFYGRKTTDEFSFSMFSSEPPFADLIFQDATTQLKVIDPEKRYFSAYLGPDFMRARRIVDCHAGSSSNNASFFTLVVLTIFAILITKN
ncbi:melanotransferrin [Harmonia axyridis]|uniref:melanotransferrin n=1 Tax=Harmonia axyridis TaxID=115357 RepID=UPI001E2755EC|nr:melanotransferrin [Harmonia axyridis]